MTTADIAAASYERIMVGVDGSGPAAQALGHALRLAKAFDAELWVVHILDSSSSDVFALDDHGAPPRSAHEQKADAEEILDGHVSGIPGIASLNLNAVLDEGDPADRLLALSEEHAVDLLVIGGKGLSGFKRFMLGSVSYAVTRRANLPVLVVYA